VSDVPETFELEAMYTDAKPIPVRSPTTTR